MKKLLLILILVSFGLSFSFAQGLNCSNPIVINSLPYSTTDNTGNYGDSTDIAQPSACAGTVANYMTGNDVFYSYTPTVNGNIGITMTPSSNWSGIFIYQGCSNVGLNCLAGVANSGSGIRSIPSLPVVAGQEYIIVISTNAAPQTLGYSLVIQSSNCIGPNSLSASGISQTSANLSWANPGGATSWEVAVQPAGSAIPTGSGIQTNINTNFPLTNLSISTAYQFYVRADCGNGTFSAWTGPFLFTTLCTPFNVPFQEGFNSTSTSESCWTIINENNDSDAWNTNYTLNPFEGDQSAVLFTDLNSGNNNDWLISPQIILTGNEVLRFNYRSQTISEPNEFKVMISTTGTNQADFTTVLLPLASYPNNTYNQVSINLAAFNGPVYIAWHVPPGTLDGWRLYIDNVVVENVNICQTPTSLTANNITATSADVTWIGLGPSNSWEIITVPCGNPAPSSNTVGQIVTSIPHTITGLSATTCYSTYVRSICSSGNSNWSLIPVNFNTTITPPNCGEIFTDNGGSNGFYLPNSDHITTICPDLAGDIVTVTFTTFDTETNWDGLYVYDGNSINAPQIASNNPSGNVPGGLAGSFWGTALPGPFMSSSPDGCLTFRFRSDNSVVKSGWTANVSCNPAPNCLKPTDLILVDITQTSATISWTENSNATSWEIIAVPSGSQLTGLNTPGQPIFTNPITLNNLTPGTTYDIYIRSTCPTTGYSIWSTPITINTLITNDECDNAIMVPVNNDNCAQVTPGRLNGATGSNVSLDTPCLGTADDDVWFQFVATNSNILTSLTNITGTTTNLNMALYSGTCGNLTRLNCSLFSSSRSLFNSDLTLGETYYLRVFSNENTPQTVTFNLCLTTPSTCIGGQSICGVNNYPNTIGIPNSGSVGCLNTTPNPSYFTIKISESGSVNMVLTQSTIGNGNPNLDVDYAAWGPFSSQASACAAVNNGMPPGIVGVPVTQSTGCSYSAAPTEHFNIPNAIAGEYYIILITNFSNQSGFINVVVEDTSTGAIDCTGIRMIAFIDDNANGTKETNEAYFPLGQFQYEINNNGTVHNITSPSGVYSINEESSANSYDLNYTINSNYVGTYNTTATYTNVVVTTVGMTTYNFPITVLQNYNDLGVTVVPMSSPRAGTTYKNKIVFTNNGTQTIASGTLSYTVNPGTTITNISVSGTTTIPNGFTYGFTNLLPFESRSIIVTISVPAIPAVTLGQLLTNAANIVPPTGDIVSTNDSSVSTQAVIAAYDPNDKMESHGEKILFSSFTADDYLEYTIRFENTGNAGAINVYVTDELDSQLDETSLIMTGASHDYTLDRVGNSLVWNFSNIMLPVSVPDTEIGKGFINFKIKPKPGYAVGDIIPNNANIYFDTNPAITTNTFNTEFVAALANPNFTSNQIIIYPNPAKHSVTIDLTQSAEHLSEIVFFDIVGKKVKVINAFGENQISIDVSDLSKGVYLIEIQTENKIKTFKKLIVQ